MFLYKIQKADEINIKYIDFAYKSTDYIEKICPKGFSLYGIDKYMQTKLIQYNYST